MNMRHCFPIGLLIILIGSGTLHGTTRPGVVGDGEASIAYVAVTGEMIIQPDLEPIGLFDIVSASGIFMANATLPPRGLGLDVNTANRISWAALRDNALISNFSLGMVGPSGLSQAFLLNDLTLTGSGGFGTPTLILDLVYTIPEPPTVALSSSAVILLLGCKPRRRGRPRPTSGRSVFAVRELSSLSDIHEQ
jgi:hypothetical protein